MNAILNMAISPFVLILRRSNLLTEDLDYHLVRASMVIMFFFFGYQKWGPYEADQLVPFISNGPLIRWLYPVFGHQGASWFLGVSEWTFGALLFAGFWDKRLGILGAAGSTATFIATVTIIPFMPDGWDPAAGFPAMTGNVPFLMKDAVLLAVSFYLLNQDVARVAQHEFLPGREVVGVSRSKPARVMAQCRANAWRAQTCMMIKPARADGGVGNGGDVRSWRSG
jgi:uncharacterized membrane protein YkgB